MYICAYMLLVVIGIVLWITGTAAVGCVCRSCVMLLQPEHLQAADEAPSAAATAELTSYEAQRDVALALMKPHTGTQ